MKDVERVENDPDSRVPFGEEQFSCPVGGRVVVDQEHIGVQSHRWSVDKDHRGSETHLGFQIGMVATRRHDDEAEHAPLAQVDDQSALGGRIASSALAEITRVPCSSATSATEARIVE